MNQGRMERAGVNNLINFIHTHTYIHSHVHTSVLKKGLSVANAFVNNSNSIKQVIPVCSNQVFIVSKAAWRTWTYKNKIR